MGPDLYAHNFLVGLLSLYPIGFDVVFHFHSVLGSLISFLLLFVIP